MTKLFVTTTDNPFSPFTQFDDWNDFDVAHGYHTCCYIDRIANTSHELSEQDNEDEINRAVKDIVRLNVLGNYLLVREDLPIALPHT